MRLFPTTLLGCLLGLALPLAAAQAAPVQPAEVAGPAYHPASVSALIVRADWHGDDHRDDDGWHRRWHHDEDDEDHDHYWHRGWAPPPRPYGYYAPAIPSGGYVYGYVYN
jgi:hypothetical protein